MKSDKRKLWKALRIAEQVELSSPHPFAFLLNYEKGMRVFSRFLRFLQSEQILSCFATILKRFECLEVSKVELGTFNKESVDVFMNHVIPPFVAVITDSPLDVINNLFRIILERHNMQWFAKSRAGLSILTVILSRAEILKSDTTAKSPEQDLGMWSDLYNFVFESLKGQFASLFPEKSSPLDELYLWQFLSAMAVGASGIEHQGILVTEVRYFFLI